MSSKRYYSKIAGSRFCFSDGQDVVFAFGFADVSEKSASGKFQGTTKDDPNNGRLRYVVYQEELDAILGRNPLIFVQEKLPENMPEVKQNAESEAAIREKEAALVRAAGGNVRTQQEINVAGDGQPTDPNASTADPILRQAFANDGAQVVPIASSGNGKLAQIRAEAEARAKVQSESAVQSISGA